MATRERHQIKTRPTPLPLDLIFFEYRDSTLPKNQNWSYGDPHPDNRRYPNHELVLVKPAPSNSAEGDEEWYYAATRENQDLYNYEVLEGEQVIRTYIIKRSLYAQRSAASVTPPDLPPLGADEFLYPEPGVATPDIVFTDYAFADDTMRRTIPELDSLYVTIQRRFIRPVIVEYEFDDQVFKRYIRITREIIPKTTASPPIGALGSSVEIRDGNNFHSVRITRELVLGDGETFPYQLPSIPSSQNYNFPSKLESVDLVGAWARAFADGQRDSYSEDYYFKFKITDPRPGPYSATLERYITDDPDAIKAANPITIVPQPVRETIAIVAAWAFASSETGTATFAIAKEQSVPATIHPLITVTIGGVASTSLADERYFTTTLAATPNVAAFLTLTEATIDYNVRELSLGLYEVSVIKINIAGLYT